MAEVFDENAVLASTGQIQYVCNPHPGDMLEEHDEKLTKGAIKGFVKNGAPAAHIGQRSFLLKTGSRTGTTTNSTLRAQYGHIPGAIERYKSKKQLQSDACEYVQLACRDSTDQQQEQKLYERYQLITGRALQRMMPCHKVSAR